MESTSANGVFSVCASGNVSIQVNCTGSNCAGLEEIPGVNCANDTTSFKCTNNVVCNSTSNPTSSFSIQQTNLTVSQQQKVSIGGQQFILNGTGSNLTTTSGAISWRFSRGNTLPKLLLCIFVLMLATQAAAESPFSPLFGQFSEALGPLLGVLEHAVCEKAVGQATEDLLDLEEKLMQTCVNLVVDAVLAGGEAELVIATGGVSEAVGGAVIGEILPIVIPSKLFAAMVTSGALCLSLLQAIVSAGIDKAAGDVCNALISSQTSPPGNPPVTPPTTIGNTTTPPTSGPIPPYSLPSDFPSAAALAGDRCVATQLSVYYTGVQGLAKSCGNSKPAGGAWDMSTTFCDPSIRPRYPTLCTEFCNNPCGSYDLQTLITNSGSAYNPSANLATASEACPGFLGTGRCTSGAPSCSCGVGALTCVASAGGCTPA